MQSSDKVTVYCDGSCHNATNSKGGYGIYMSWGSKVRRIAGGRWDRTTNNRMELLAVIESLRNIKAKRGYQIEIISDSQYVINPIVERWVFAWEQQQFLGKKNEDLWLQFLEEYRKFRPQDLTFTWVKGHNKNAGNEEADRLAGIGGSKETITIDEGSGL